MIQTFGVKVVNRLVFRGGWTLLAWRCDVYAPKRQRLHKERFACRTEAEAASDRMADAIRRPAVVAAGVGDDFYRREDDRVVRSHEADPDAALAPTEVALKAHKAEADKTTNLAYRSLVEQRADLHVAAGRPAEARKGVRFARHGAVGPPSPGGCARRR